MSLVSEGAEFRGPLAAGSGLAEPSLASVGDYLALMKPRVMSLVVFTALVGLVLAPGHMHPVIAFTALLCIAVGAGAAGALNMWYDADIDARMARTAGRLLGCRTWPSGQHLCRAVAGGDHRLLCRRLHNLAQTRHAAEHRDRRRR